MPTIKLTKRSIDAIEPPASGQVFYRDTDLAGFGLRVGPRARTFFAEAQVRRRTVRVSLGRYGILEPERARKLAMKALSEMADGRDVHSERREKSAKSLTLREAFDAFFEGR